MDSQASSGSENRSSDVLRSLEQLGLGYNITPSVSGSTGNAYHDHSNVQMSPAALEALKLFVKQSRNELSQSSSGGKTPCGDSEQELTESRGRKYEIQSRKAHYQAHKLLESCSSECAHHECWKQSCAPQAEELLLSEFLLVSKHSSQQKEREGYLASRYHTKWRSIKAVEKLQKRYQGTIIHFFPLQEGWNSLELFNRLLEKHREVQAELFGGETGPNTHRLAWSVWTRCQYPEWYYSLVADVAEGRLEGIQKFTREHGDYQFLLNLPDINGQTLLHRAASHGHKGVVEMLLECGAWLNMCDVKGRTPLHDACWTAKDNSEVIILILKRNPSLLNAVDDFGAVPLEYIPRSASDLHEKYYTLLASVAEELWGGLA